MHERIIPTRYRSLMRLICMIWVKGCEFSAQITRLELLVVPLLPDPTVTNVAMALEVEVPL